jgi:hypothetical protein
MLFLFSACGVSSTSCGTIPKDGTPPWDSANRFAVEMQNDCNSITSSIGLSGCAFYPDRIYGNLRLPALLPGSVYLTSSMCQNVASTTTLDSDNIFWLQDLYTNRYKTNCSFEITRKVKLQDIQSDRTLRGRFFIKILDNPYYTRMKMAIENKSFLGVSWFQRKTNTPELESMSPIVVIYPSGTRGTFKVTCNDKLIENRTYTNGYFEWAPPEGSCDYELSAINSDSKFIDVGTLMLEEQYLTLDITTPRVTVTSKEITFSFLDLDASGRKYVVAGVRVDSTNCPGSSCLVLNNKTTYSVRAITAAGRFFSGKYNILSKRWEIY